MTDAEPVTTITPPPRPATPEPEPAAPPLTVITPRRGWAMQDLRELWRFRELLVFLAWRDIQIRYKQTVLGIGWAVAQPLATMLVFTVVLGRVGGIAAGIEHYPLFVFASMVAWTFFINIVTTAGNSIIANERLITKVYFPRLLIPLGTVGVAVFDLMIGSVLLAVLMVAFGVVPGWSILLMPLVVLSLAVAAAGFGILFAALIVAQRDFKYILAFAAQLWLFATPCIYLSADALSPDVRVWLPLNPAYGLVKGFREAVLGGPFDWYSFGVSTGVGILALVGGVLYFRRAERSFADTI